MSNNVKQIILIGDPNQLPSIQYGAVLRDIKDANIIASVDLYQIARQVEGSFIIKNAHLMLNLKSKTEFENGHDFECRFVEEDPYKEAFAYIKSNASDKKFTVVCFKNEDVKNANKELQELYNPSLKKFSRRFSNKYCKEFQFKDKDPVYFLKNKYKNDDDQETKYDEKDEDDDVDDSSIYLNGERGEVNVDNNNQWYVRYAHNDRDQFISLETEALDISPSYVSNVWKLQGSQFDNIVIILNGSKFTDRSTLYTAITCASKFCIIFTTQESLQNTLQNNQIRKTRVKEFLQLKM